MEAHARAPDPLTEVGNMANNWQSWKEDFIIFMKVTGYINKPNETRANLLKNRIGKIGIEAIQNMSFDHPQDKDNMDILIVKLEEFFNPPKKEVVERYHFFTTSRKQSQSIEQYISNLKEKAKTCNFEDMTNSIIRDKIILDTHDKILRKKLLETDNLDLQKLIAVYNDYKINAEEMTQVTGENQAKFKNFAQTSSSNNSKKACWRCSHQHPQGKCPAWGSRCTKCGDKNHFTQCCKGFKPNPGINTDKVNKNLLNPMEQTRNFSKSNDKLWNNRADAAAITSGCMDKMTSFPNVPTVSYDAANSTLENDTVSDILSTHPNFYHNNTMNQLVHLPNKSQYNTSMKTAKSEWVFL